MPDILVSESLAGPDLDSLGHRYSVSVEPELWRDEPLLVNRLADTRALIVRNQTRVTSDVIRAADRLEVIGRAGTGLDNIDVAAATEAGVAVCYAPDQNSCSVAELAMAMLLALARRVVTADRDTRAGGWARSAFMGIELYGKTLGVVGFGRIGFLLAMRARAFGMRVLAHDPFISPDAVTVTESGAELVGLDELLARADVVSCHLPSTPATHKLFNADRFRMMKPTALFLNLARGDEVDEPALVEALQSGQIAGAGLDVRALEPPASSSLNAMDNVVLTPHIAAFTVEAQARIVAAVCRDVAAVLDGRSPLYCVNAAALSEKRSLAPRS
ncbi:MAG: hydroxyacid dehydrogenase [Luteitalea sp.]|nr:hydroxyacid dehydrogenase [Luteitalea sp.]